jgi:hypothetical protein
MTSRLEYIPEIMKDPDFPTTEYDNPTEALPAYG